MRQNDYSEKYRFMLTEKFQENHKLGYT